LRPDSVFRSPVAGRRSPVAGRLTAQPDLLLLVDIKRGEDAGGGSACGLFAVKRESGSPEGGSGAG